MVQSESGASQSGLPGGGTKKCAPKKGAPQGETIWDDQIIQQLEEAYLGSCTLDICNLVLKWPNQKNWSINYKLIKKLKASFKVSCWHFA
jgi:hypothetical protein